MERSIVPVAFLSFVMMLDAQMVCWQVADANVMKNVIVSLPITSI